jgi:hypothetical protein
MTIRFAIPALAALVAAPAFAALNPQATLPTEHHRGNISWMSGGIGQDEARAMRREAARYPLEVLFVERSGKRDEFLADMPLTIRDAKGDVVFRGRSSGPYFLAKLPAGRYAIATREDGRALTRHAVIGGKGTKRVVFEWRHGEGRRNA